MPKPKKFIFTKNVYNSYNFHENLGWHIKFKGNFVGSIEPYEPHKISLRIHKEPTKDSPSNWKWITLKKESATPEEAKDFLNNNIDAIMKTYRLYFEKEEEK